MAHTRFVPTQLYRLMVLSWGISGVVSLATRPADSVTTVANGVWLSWFDWFLPIAQIAAAVTVLTGLYLVQGSTHHARKLGRSLLLELIGIIELEMVIAWQTAASVIYQGRVPSAGTSWMAIIFGTWILVRVRDIVRAQRELGRTT